MNADRVRWLVLILFSSLATACAVAVAELYQEPQQVMITPELAAEPTAIGFGRMLVLEVVDRRPKNILGYRGGVDPTTAPVYPKSSVVDAVRDALTAALTRSDFMVHSSTAATSLHMRVEIERLDYAANHELWPTAIKSSGAVKVICENGFEYYSNRYAAEYSESVKWPPGETGIAKNINKALSETLDRLLSDPKLLEVLSHGGETRRSLPRGAAG